MPVSESPKVVSPFRGDCTEKETPAEWFTLFQLGLPDSWTETRKVNRFELQLYPGSLADEWFNALHAADKTSLSALKAAFLKRWPPDDRPTWTKAQQRDKIILKEEDICEWKEDGGVGDHGHNLWADKVKRLALSMGDTEGNLISHVILHAPRIIREQLTDEYDTWSEFTSYPNTARTPAHVAIGEAAPTDADIQLAYVDQQQWLDAADLAALHAAKRKLAFDRKVLKSKVGEVIFDAGQLVQVHDSALENTKPTTRKLLPQWSPSRRVLEQVGKSYKLSTLEGFPMNGLIYTRRLRRFLPRDGTALAKEDQVREKETDALTDETGDEEIDKELEGDEDAESRSEEEQPEGEELVRAQLSVVQS